MPGIEMPLDMMSSAENSSLSSTENIASSRASSSEGQNIVIFEQDQVAIMPHFIPTFPPRTASYEPKLDELLVQASGSANLDTLSQIQLRVTSHMFGLHRLNIFVPALVALNLDGSSLNTLRDLGDDLTIKYLNVSRCGLRNFDGVNGFTTLEHLVADDNSIKEIAQLANLPNLCKLSVRGNQIGKFGTVSFLASCRKLQNLDLTSNPISSLVDYENKLKELIPQLLILDGRAVSEQSTANYDSDKFTLSELSSSLSSVSKGSSSYGSVGQCDEVPVKRPASSYHRPHSVNSQNVHVRPSTAGPLQKSGSLTTGNAIVGNIVTKARNERCHRRYSSNSSSSINSTSSRTSFDSNSNSKLKFANILSQNKVRTELHAIAMSVKSPDANTSIADDHHNETINDQ